MLEGDLKESEFISSFMKERTKVNLKEKSDEYIQGFNDCMSIIGDAIECMKDLKQQ